MTKEPSLPHDPRIPVIMLTGFLGSGKTTLLSKLLAKPGMGRVAVIVNEYGELGLDHLLITSPRNDVVLLSGGCLCCMPRDEIATTLNDLLKSSRSGEIPEFDSVVIETSGLANPSSIIQMLLADPAAAANFRSAGVVTTVDAVNADETFARHRTSVSQVAAADRIVLTKADLVAAGSCADLEARLRRLNPWAAIKRALHGDIDTAFLTTTGSARPEEEAAGAVKVEHLGKAPDSHVHHHDSGINSFTVTRDEPVRAAGLDVWIDMMAAYCGPGLLRVKGLLNVDGHPVAIHAVQRVFHPPSPLSAWPSDDRRSHIVFITRGLTKAEVETTLVAFNLALLEPGLTARNYEHFVDALKGFQSPH